MAKRKNHSADFNSKVALDAIPQGPKKRWSLDFMWDAPEDGRRFGVLNVINDFSRECLATVVDTPISGARVARDLDRKVDRHYIAPGETHAERPE